MHYFDAGKRQEASTMFGRKKHNQLKTQELDSEIVATGRHAEALLRYTIEVQSQLQRFFVASVDIGVQRQDLFAKILEWAKQRTDSAYAAVFLVTKHDELVLDVWVGHAAMEQIPIVRFPLNVGLAGRAARTQKTQFVPDVRRDSDYLSFIPDTRSELAVPLVRGNTVLGTLAVGAKEAKAYDIGSIRDVEYLANQIVLTLIAFELAQLQRDSTKTSIAGIPIAATTLPAGPQTLSAASPHIFVSYSHQDLDFAAHLAEDLQHAGAQVWFDRTNVKHGSFVARINEALRVADWCVVVLSPDALESQPVAFEVNGAIALYLRERLLGVVPIVSRPCDPDKIPPLWAQLQRYDATTNYQDGLQNLLSALGLPSSR